MALSSSEQQQIRTYLGYSDTNVSGNAWLTSTMGQISTDSETAIRSLLGELTGIDTQLATVRAKRFQVIKIEGIELMGPMETKALRQEAARIANRIGVILGIDIKEDVFAAGGGSGALPMG